MTTNPASQVPEPLTNIDRIRSLLVLAALLGTIIFNWLAATGYLGSITPAAISREHPTVVTPADYAFSIWTLIYLGLAVFSIYQLTRKANLYSRPIRSLFIFTCALNCAWLFFWLQDQIVVCAALIWALAVVLILIDKKLRELNAALFLPAVFGIYLGWVIVAALINSVIAFSFGNGTRSFGEYEGAVMVLIAAGVGVALRVLLTDYFAPLAIAWGLTAIAVQQSGKTAIVSAAAVGVVACLIASFTFVLNLKSSRNE
jgi:translocator protein